MHLLEKTISRLFPRKRFDPQTARTLAVVAICTILLATFGDFAAAQDDVCATTASNAKQRLNQLLTTRGTNGSLIFEGPNELFDRYPLFTTVGLSLYQQDKDVEFLRTLHASATAHLNYTLARADADGDFLLEKRVQMAADGRVIEDVAYNAMFAADMLSLAALCVELRLPVDALYWYQGMRTISDQMVRVMYDAHSGNFHSYDNASKRRDGGIEPLSALPVFFTAAAGDNVSNAVIRNYVLRGQGSQGASPYDVVTNSDTFVETDAASRLASLALLTAINANGFHDAALAFSGRVRPTPSGEYAPYFDCLLEQGAYRTFFPRVVELRILESIAARSGLIERDTVNEFTAAINAIEKHLIERNETDLMTYRESEALQQSVRRVYMTLSQMRGWWKQSQLFTPVDRRRIPGFDSNAAFDLAANHAIKTLHQVENDITRSRSFATGFDVNATVATEHVAPGAEIHYRIGLSTLVSPVAVKSVTVTSRGKREVIRKPPDVTSVRPGVPRYYDYRFTPASSQMSTLVPVDMTVEVGLNDGKRLQYHFHHGVFISPPVTFELLFPQGDVASGTSLPVSLVIEKHVEKSMRVHAEWFSPTGLQLQQGKSLDLTIPGEEKRVEVPLTVMVPHNARPGSFPFVLKLFEGPQERGTIRANLFKHYNWLFLGPLPDTGGADGEHPPERGVKLMATYASYDGKINWKPLPDRMYEVNGRVNLNEALQKGSIGYLYTVIKTNWEITTLATLASQSPATFYVNGHPLLTIDDHELGTFKRSPIVLQPGLNRLLVKVHAEDAKNVFVQLGREDDLTFDEFSNDLWDLVDGYAEFVERSRNNFAPTDASRLVTLTYSNPGANSVAVIGSFNGWSPIDTHMRKAKGGTWEISLHLPPGRYAYRLLIDDDQQILDPANSIQEPDGYGGMNSVLFVR